MFNKLKCNICAKYLREADIEIRKKAIYSLGRIQLPQDTEVCEPALACLELSISKETDDQLLGILVESAFSLYKHDKSTF